MRWQSSSVSAKPPSKGADVYKRQDHTREYVPYLVYGKGVKPGVDLGTRLCFGTIAQTICEYLGVDASSLDGKSVWNEIKA